MSTEQPKVGLQLPESLQTQLHEFRRRVWTIKSIEAACGALFGVVVSYLVVFGLDRMMETPAEVRLVVFLVAVGGCAFVPVYLHRWIWCHRRFEQLARLVSRKLPLIGAAWNLQKTMSAMSAPRTLRRPAVHHWVRVASMLPPRG